MSTLNTFLKTLPWLLVLALIGWIMLSEPKMEPVERISNEVILTKIEALGKLELVKYNFKEITELQHISPEYFKIFKLGPDSKIALISVGEAVGCIDLTKIESNDIQNSDTLYIKLPAPELCYFKLDLDKTRIYSLETNPMLNKEKFIETAYKNAEAEIKRAALNSGILENAYQNASIILKPFLEELAGKPVIFTQTPIDQKIDLAK